MQEKYQQNCFSNIDSVLSSKTDIKSSMKEINDQKQTFQSLLSAVGAQDKYQIILLLILCTLWLTSSMFLVGITFFFDNNYQCYATNDPIICQQIVCNANPQQQQALISKHIKSVVFELHLLCGNSQSIIKVLQSMIYIGSLFGFVIFSTISTKYGILKSMRVNWVICTIGVAIFTFSANQWMIAIGLFIIGFGANPSMTLCYCLVNQQCSEKYRQYFSIAFKTIFALGQCLIAALFWTPLTWRQMCYIILGVVILVNFLFLYCVESPKYLATYSDITNSLKALNNIAHKNNKKQLIMSDMKQIQIKSQNNNQFLSFATLFQQKRIRTISFSIGVVFFSVQSVYYCTAFSFQKVGYDKILNQIMTGVAQIFSYLTVKFVVQCLKRKKFSIVCIIITSIVCQNQDNRKLIEGIETSILIILRMINTGFWGFFYVYCGQLYEGKYLRLGLSFVSLCGMFGCISSPYLVLFSESMNISIWLTIGVISIFTTIFILLLHQTNKNKSFVLPLKAISTQEDQTIEKCLIQEQS